MHYVYESLRKCKIYNIFTIYILQNIKAKGLTEIKIKKKCKNSIISGFKYFTHD